MTFLGDPGHGGALGAGQHCLDGGSGGPCNVQYLLENVDFSGVPPGKRFINFGVHAKPPAEVLPVFISTDSSLGGFRSIVSKHLNGFEAEGCVKLGESFDSGYGCPFSVRRLSIWSRTDLGPVRLQGPGFGAEPNFEMPVEGKNAGHLSYSAGYNGYGALAIVGRNYSLSINVSADAYIDFSDPFLPGFFNETEETISLVLPNGDCDVHATEAHGRFYGRFGPVRGASTGNCKKALSPPCHTTVEGEPCFRAVDWAHTWGLRGYPDKFPTLTIGATRDQIQMYFYMTYQSECALPCAAAASPAGSEGNHSMHADIDPAKSDDWDVSAAKWMHGSKSGVAVVISWVSLSIAAREP